MDDICEEARMEADTYGYVNEVRAREMAAEIERLRAELSETTREFHAVLDSHERIGDSEMMQLLRRVNRQFEQQIKEADGTLARVEAAEQERDRLREALNTMITLFGRSGDAFTDFEEIAALFQRETGKMRPGKDAPLPELAASHDEFRAWVSGHCVEAQKIVHETAQALAEDSPDD